MRSECMKEPNHLTKIIKMIFPTTSENAWGDDLKMHPKDSEMRERTIIRIKHMKNAADNLP